MSHFRFLSFQIPNCDVSVGQIHIIYPLFVLCILRCAQNAKQGSVPYIMSLDTKERYSVEEIHTIEATNKEFNGCYGLEMSFVSPRI